MFSICVLHTRGYVILTTKGDAAVDNKKLIPQKHSFTPCFSISNC